MYASIGFYDDRGWTLADHVKRITANIKNSFYWNEDKIKADVYKRQISPYPSEPEYKLGLTIIGE